MAQYCVLHTAQKLPPRYLEEYSHKQMYIDHTAKLIAKKEVQELKVASYYVINLAK